jgi:hypothetical protein
VDSDSLVDVFSSMIRGTLAAESLPRCTSGIYDVWVGLGWKMHYSLQNVGMLSGIGNGVRMPRGC